MDAKTTDFDAKRTNVVATFIFMIYLMYWIYLMSCIYVIYLMCWKYLIDLITHSRNRNRSRNRNSNNRNNSGDSNNKGARALRTRAPLLLQ